VRCRLEQWPAALEDATECIKLRPDWPKSYYRHAPPAQERGRAGRRSMPPRPTRGAADARMNTPQRCTRM